MSLPSSMADFVPRDRQLQKAYCIIKSSYQWNYHRVVFPLMGILFTQFHCVTNISEVLSWTRLRRMCIFRLQNLFSCNCNKLNHRSLSCSQVISITISVWKLKYGRIYQKLRCLVQEPMMTILMRKKRIKSRLQPLYLQSELIILSFNIIGC